MDFRIRWYHTLLFRSLACAAAIFILCITGFSLAVSAFQTRQAEKDRAAEMTRVAEAARQNTPSMVIDAVQSLALLHPEDRILLLDQESRILYDSSGARTGSLWINEETQQALSGTRVIARGSQYLRIAVPLLNPDQEPMVLYTYIQKAAFHKGIWQKGRPVVLIAIGFGMAGYAILCFCLYSWYRPLREIRRWLSRMAAGDRDAPLDSKYNKEYQALLDSVRQITKDLMDISSKRQIFVSNVSHELKTPLSSMKVLVDTLLLQNPIPQNTAREFLEDIRDEIDRQNSMINDLLTLVRLDSSEAMKPAAYSLNDILENTIKRLKPLADQKHVTLRLEASREVVAQCDETKISIAFSNLIENGIKYNRENGSVTVHLDASFRYAKIQVKDTGVGIAEKHFAKLFDQFYRVDQARDRDAGGTGLGLSIVKQIILLHHGSIDVESTVGEGTSFIISLPLRYTVPKRREPDEQV